MFQKTIDKKYTIDIILTLTLIGLKKWLRPLFQGL